MLFSVSRKSHRVAVMYDIQSGLATSLKMARHSVIGGVLEWLERVTLNQVDRVITLSQAMSDAIRRIGVKVPISIIPPKVDDELIQPRPESPGPITLLYSANIGRKQGLEQLIDLAEHLQQRQLNAEIILRGDGNYRAELQRQAEARAVENLRFEPLLQVDRLSEGLAQGHIHLVPQNPAGAAFAVPSKIYSIMAAGRPFICTADPGSPMDRLRAESDAFIICAPNQPEALADAVEGLMMDAGEWGGLVAMGGLMSSGMPGGLLARRLIGECFLGGLGKAPCLNLQRPSIRFRTPRGMHSRGLRRLAFSRDSGRDDDRRRAHQSTKPLQGQPAKPQRTPTAMLMGPSTQPIEVLAAPFRRCHASPGPTSSRD